MQQICTIFEVLDRSQRTPLHWLLFFFFFQVNVWENDRAWITWLHDYPYSTQTHVGFSKMFFASACLDTLHLHAPHFQIGSYFGAELCSVDIDSDGNTDFLLVGAPLFYQPHEKKEGWIYVYKLSEKVGAAIKLHVNWCFVFFSFTFWIDAFVFIMNWLLQMQLETVLNVTAPFMGRFGTTISSLADLNGDELRDVAVGAPLEDDNRGAVYIYLGDRRTGIRSNFSQVSLRKTWHNISLSSLTCCGYIHQTHINQ